MNDHGSDVLELAKRATCVNSSDSCCRKSACKCIAGNLRRERTRDKRNFIHLSFNFLRNLIRKETRASFGVSAKSCASFSPKLDLIRRTGITEYYTSNFTYYDMIIIDIASFNLLKD